MVFVRAVRSPFATFNTSLVYRLQLYSYQNPTIILLCAGALAHVTHRVITWCTSDPAIKFQIYI